MLSVKREAKALAIETRNVLMSEFGKDVKEAEDLINSGGMVKDIEKHPLLLHDTAHDWAVILLSEAGENDVLDRVLGL